MHYGSFTWVICCLLSGMQALGQPVDDYYFRHVTQADGLINNRVFVILQDSRGFVWIGTQNGIQRYDGTRFVNYQEELNPKNKSQINVGMIDLMGNMQLYFSNRRKLDLPSNNISRYNQQELLKDIPDTSNIFYDEKKHLWVAGNRYAYIYEQDSIPTILSMARDTAHHKTWVATPMGLRMMDHKTKRIYSMQDNPLHNPLLQQHFVIDGKGIMMDSRQNLWINTWTEIFYKYNLSTGKLTSYSLRAIKSKNHFQNADLPMLVNQVYEDNHQQIWLATANAGLLHYNVEQDDFTSITSRQDNSRGIQYNYEVFCIFQDKEDNIWLGTDRGINIFNPYHQYFKIIKNEEEKKNTLPKREITSILQTRRGDIWIGTWGGGIAIYNDQLEIRKRIDFPGQFESNLVWCLLEDDDGRIWVGCQHGYIHICDPQTGHISTLQPDALQHSTVRCMRKDKNGNILFGLHNGKISSWIKNRNEFYAYNDNGLRTPPFPTIHNIFIDQQGNCWVSTEIGLKVFNSEKRTFTQTYLPFDNQPSSFEGIAEENDSVLLVGVMNGGVALFNKKNRTFSFSGTAEKLSKSTVHAIRKDALGNWWITTDYNIYKYSPGFEKYVSYNTEPGVINSNFQLTDFYSLKDGRWISATYSEIISFFPDTLSRQGNAPLPVEITGLRLFDKPIFLDSFLFNRRPVRLSYRQNFITIEFATLSFSNFRQIKYFYRLSNVDHNWVSADISGTANYTNLLPGNYTFDVMADDEGKLGQISSFQFIIQPAFWQTWWFRIGCILAFAYIIFWLVRRRITVIRRQAALRQQVAETEMMALRAQMNPHFIFNCINSIDAMIQSNDKYRATLFLNKFAKLIRNILDSSKLNTVPLTKDLETLQLYIALEQFRNNNRFNFEIRADAELIQQDYRIPPLIIQPYVENAILHGLRHRPDNEGLLTISVSQEDGKIVYIIEDNGVGRNSEHQVQYKEKKSYGIQISNDRVRLFNKESKASVEITDLKSNGLPTGTIVRLTLKIQ